MLCICNANSLNMIESVEYNNESIFVVSEYESWPTNGTLHRAKEIIPLEAESPRCEVDGKMVLRLPYYLDNLDTGNVYHLKSMLKSNNMGELILADIVDRAILDNPDDLELLPPLENTVRNSSVMRKDHHDDDEEQEDDEELNSSKKYHQQKLYHNNHHQNHHVAIKVYDKKKMLENPSHGKSIITDFVQRMQLNGSIIPSDNNLPLPLPPQCNGTTTTFSHENVETLKRIRLNPENITFRDSLQSHPHIIAQIDCCETPKRIYSILEFCKGLELFDYIDRHGPLPIQDAKHVFLQLLSVLSYLQQLGVVHRDISMENILYDVEEKKLTMIIDFGMAVRLTASPTSQDQYPRKPFLYDAKEPLVSSAHHYCWVNDSLGRQYSKNYGKIQYIAPEIMREEPYFHPMLCEIWSAGIVLFIMLVGFPPFEYATQADERFVMITSHELTMLLESWEINLDPLAIDLLEKLLNPNPNERLKIEEILIHPWMQST